MSVSFLEKVRLLNCSQTSDRLLSISADEGKPTSQIANAEISELDVIPVATVRKLNELSTAKLAEFSQHPSENTYSLAEITAAAKMIQKSTHENGAVNLE